MMAGFLSPRWRGGPTTGATNPHPSPRNANENASENTSLPPTANEVEQSIAEGRRVYLGNIDYTMGAVDIQEFLQQAGFRVRKLHISVDAAYGRNPGYCFIEFDDKPEAERALAELGGAMLCGRAVRVGPCEPKRADGKARYLCNGRERERTWEKPGSWSYWRGSSGGDQERAPGVEFVDRRWQDHVAGDADTAVQPAEADTDVQAARRSGGRRNWQTDKERTLYVGRLPRPVSTAAFESQMRDIFKGFDVVSISKAKNPSNPVRENPDTPHRYFCFVEFLNPEDASAARDATDGVIFQGTRLRVSKAKGKS